MRLKLPVVDDLYEEARSVYKCPLCKAKPGQPCRSSGGRIYPWVHERRVLRLKAIYQKGFEEGRNVKPRLVQPLRKVSG